MREVQRARTSEPLFASSSHSRIIQAGNRVVNRARCREKIDEPRRRTMEENKLTEKTEAVGRPTTARILRQAIVKVPEETLLPGMRSPRAEGEGAGRGGGEEGSQKSKSSPPREEL